MTWKKTETFGGVLSAHIEPNAAEPKQMDNDSYHDANATHEFLKVQRKIVQWLSQSLHDWAAVHLVKKKKALRLSFQRWLTTAEAKAWKAF